MKTVERVSAPLDLCVQYAEESPGAPARSEVAAWVHAAADTAADIADAAGEVTIRFVGEEEMSALNGKYRGKPQPTNVLSFDYHSAPFTSGAPGALLGDVLVCVPVVQREAQAMAIPPVARYAHLVVHGVLHLAGYRHDTPPAAAQMEAMEARILRQFDIADPHQ